MFTVIDRPYHVQIFKRIYHEMEGAYEKTGMVFNNLCSSFFSGFR